MIKMCIDLRNSFITSVKEAEDFIKYLKVSDDELISIAFDEDKYNEAVERVNKWHEIEFLL